MSKDWQLRADQAQYRVRKTEGKPPGKIKKEKKKKNNTIDMSFSSRMGRGGIRICESFLYQCRAAAVFGGSDAMGRVFYYPKTDRYQDYVFHRRRHSSCIPSVRRDTPRWFEGMKERTAEHSLLLERASTRIRCWFSLKLTEIVSISLLGK